MVSVSLSGLSVFAYMGAKVKTKQRKRRTVWDAAYRRGGCRTGLRGVVVEVEGRGGRHVIHSSHWEKDAKLMLSIYAESDPAPAQRWTVPTEKRLTHSLADLTSGRLVIDYPPSFIPEIPADQCILLSEWPETCCRSKETP